MSINTISEAIPYRISEYIKQRFGETFPFETKTVEGDEDDVLYKVEIRKDELFYQLKFDKYGYLLERDIYHA